MKRKLEQISEGVKYPLEYHTRKKIPVMNYDKVSRLSSKLKVFYEIMKRGSEKRDIQGNFSNSGVPTSRRIQETMSERPKRPQ